MRVLLLMSARGEALKWQWPNQQRCPKTQEAAKSAIARAQIGAKPIGSHQMRGPRAWPHFRYRPSLSRSRQSKAGMPEYEQLTQILRPKQRRDFVKTLLFEFLQSDDQRKQEPNGRPHAAPPNLK